MVKDLYIFRSHKWEHAAFTHSSLKNGHAFERLEFMGDRVLATVIADLLWKAFPKAHEGELSKRSANLVCRATCEQIARQIQLGDHLDLASRSDLERSSVLANALEAWLGAIYMDGGFDVVYKVIAHLWKTYIAEAPFYDYKSKLQEWAQKHEQALPIYSSTVEGDDHTCVHMAEVCVLNDCASGSGPSRKAAEQDAAKALLDKLKE